MQNSKYFNFLNNADIIFNITSLWPLIVWLWFGSQLLKHLVPATSKAGIRLSKTIAFPLYVLHFIIFLLWLIPVYLSFRDLYYRSFINSKGKFAYDPTTPSLPPGYGYCLSSKVKQEDVKKGIIAYWDYKCEKANRKLITSGATSLLNRFYYINYAIFLIVLLVYRALVEFNVLNNKFILLNVRVALLLGVIGCIIPVFDRFYYRSEWFSQSWSYLLSMNSVCLMLIGLSIFSYTRKWCNKNNAYCAK
jgi:hypothetical protein